MKILEQNSEVGVKWKSQNETKWQPLNLNLSLIKHIYTLGAGLLQASPNFLLPSWLLGVGEGWQHWVLDINWSAAQSSCRESTVCSDAAGLGRNVCNEWSQWEKLNFLWPRIRLQPSLDMPAVHCDCKCRDNLLVRAVIWSGGWNRCFWFINTHFGCIPFWLFSAAFSSTVKSGFVVVERIKYVCFHLRQATLLNAKHVQQREGRKQGVQLL